jgi:hypothetical protein
MCKALRILPQCSIIKNITRVIKQDGQAKETIFARKNYYVEKAVRKVASSCYCETVIHFSLCPPFEVESRLNNI